MGGRRFTLMELLVVMAMVLLLVSLLLPAVTGAQRKGEQVQCAGNLRQLSLAMTMYAQSSGWRLPPYVRSSTYEHGGTNWARYLRGYYDDVRTLDCPTSPDGPPADSREGLHLYDGNYGWNYDGTQGNRGSLYQHVLQPAKGYLLFDSGDPCVIYGANRWDNLMEELDLDWDSGKEGPNRHGDSVNVMFVDGHLASLRLYPFLSAPCRTNRPPWYIEWEFGELQPGVVPFPVR